MRINIGISGWTYPKWRGNFYPENIKVKDELPYASRVLNSIEVNGTFYRTQKAKTFENWHNQTPTDFKFSIKAHRFITHIKRLKECEQALSNFFGSGILELGPKLGVILWQFPPFVTFKDQRFHRFFEILPRDTDQALKLASQAEKKWRTPLGSFPQETFPIRHAFEMRHTSFQNDEFLKLAEDQNIVLVEADSNGKWPEFVNQGPIRYWRLHGLRIQQYSSGEIQSFSQKLQAMVNSENPPDEVFIYFDNEDKTKAPLNALELKKEIEIFTQKGRSIPHEVS